jgi:hypothetical protein
VNGQAQADLDRYLWRDPEAVEAELARLGVASRRVITAGPRRVPEAGPWRVLRARMAGSGVELLVGRAMPPKTGGVS